MTTRNTIDYLALKQHLGNQLKILG